MRPCATKTMASGMILMKAEARAAGSEAKVQAYMLVVESKGRLWVL